MSAALIGVAGLVVIFAVSMWRNVNMGAVAIVCAFVLGVFVFHQSAADIAGRFPGGLLITLVGVTFLFSIARTNGTVDRVVGGAVAAVRGRAALVPWVFFLLAALITGSGALSAATNAILVPLGLAFALKYRINPVLIGLSILNGTNAGGFTPLSVYYNIVAGALGKIGLSVDPLAVFAWTFVASLLLNVVAFLLFGGRDLLARLGTPEELVHDPEFHEQEPTSRWLPEQLLTVVLMSLLLVVALVFKQDVGFLAMTAAVILSVVFPRHTKEAMQHIGWGVVLLIGGIVTYISMLEKEGVVADLAGSISGISTPVVAALLILFLAAVVSAFASTNAMFVVLVPLAAPLLQGGELGVLGFTIALCIAASVVDSSPFSTGGALVVANSEEDRQDSVFRALVVWGMSMIVVAPPLAWLAFVVL